MSFKLRIQPGRPITEMETGDLAKIVSADHKGAVVLKTAKGIVSLSNPGNPLGRLTDAARVEFVDPASADLTFA